jgi:hypothetical protein
MSTWGPIYRAVRPVITMPVMPPLNCYALRHYRDRVITVFCHLQRFPC